MNGPHDVGGKHGFGAIAPEQDEPVFHEPWEGRMFGIAYCILTSGCNTIDETRYAMEKMPHAHYLGSSYYEHWLYAYERILREKGIVTTEEIDARMRELPDEPIEPHPRPSDNPSELARRVMAVLERGRPKHVPAWGEPSFAVGQRVRTLNIHSKRHIRLPAYAKGREGVVHAHRGHLDHPEARAACEPDPGAHVYTVGFEARELWGPSAERDRDVIHLDLIEDYLEAA